MSSSIQRGGYWWNQGPDGTWLRWSPQNSAWEAQPDGPPPPGAPPPPPAPVSSAPEATGGHGAVPPARPPVQTREAEEANAQVEQRSGSAAGEKARSADAPSTTAVAGSPVGVKANAPIFSTSGSRPPAPFENKVFLGVVGAIVIAMAFFGTYKGANIFFSNAYGSPGDRTDDAADAKSFSPAKRAYIAKLDRLCAKDQDRMERFQARLLASESPRELQRVFDRLLELAERNLARIEGFDKPKEDRRLLNRIIGLQRETLPLLDRILDAVQARNSAAVDAIAAEVYANAAKSRRLMGVYGFKVCGEA